MKEYRYSIRDNETFDTTTEYFKRLKDCKKAMFYILSVIYMFSTDISIMIDTLENNIIINTKILKGKEFIIS